jgi:hypothetical protein
MITKPVLYTEEFVSNELLEILKEVLENKDLIVLGEVFEKKPYSSQRFSEWSEKFKENDEISESIKKIKDVFENRVNVGGLRGKLNPAMSIFNLKNNYGWKDKTEQDVDVTSGGKPIYGSLSRHHINEENIQPQEEN